MNYRTEKRYFSPQIKIVSSSAFLSGIIDSQDADGMLTFSVPEDARINYIIAVPKKHILEM